MTERSEPLRQQMRAAWAALRIATQGEFAHDGLVYRGVPAEAVTAFVTVEFEGGEDRVVEALRAFTGVDPRPLHGADADWIGWRVGRAWVAALESAWAASQRRAAA
jgi:hypothetical protein